MENSKITQIRLMLDEANTHGNMGALLYIVGYLLGIIEQLESRIEKLEQRIYDYHNE